ncbi:MAG TPA: indole-3-glycerol phosphate synthase TrpC [Bacteroidetes bacterium]|nr:indole-3-glycerol phosphate synthase TrpC [Bacteroidota bacterium]
MNNKLSEILEYKKNEVVQHKLIVCWYEIIEKACQVDATLDFENSLKNAGESGFACIAEIKKASPSKGLITKDFQPSKIAREYKEGGAAALSVLTDEKYFRGHSDYVLAAKNASSLPILRKDFIVDEYQIYESRVIGADAILLIVAALTETQLRSYLSTANELSLAVLVECHTKQEIERALDAGATIIGINRRDLQTFTVNVELSFQLKNFIPNSCIGVSESGIKNFNTIERLSQAGFDAVLVGEHLMAQPDRRKALNELLTPQGNVR